MKHGLTLTELAQKIESEQANRNDYVAKTPVIEAVEIEGKKPALEFMTPGLQRFELTDHAQAQVAQHTGVPVKYARKMLAEAPGLWATNVNTWFGENPQKRMVRTVGDSARAFLSDRYRTLDNYELSEALFPILAEKEVEIVSADITETKMYIKVVDPKLKGRVDWGEGHNFGRAADDEIIWCATISNSEVGAGSLQVSTMTLSSWCSNLMIVGKEFRKYHVGRAIDDTGAYYKDETRQADDRATFLKLRDTVDHALTEVAMNDTLAKYNYAAQNDIEGDPVKAVEKLAKRLRTTEKEESSILRHLINGGTLTQWGLANAVTRTAEDACSYDRATELEAAGMTVVELRPSEWKEIAA